MMEIVDAQIHTFDADNQRYPWHKGPEFNPQKHSTTPFTYDQALAAMAEAGVDAAVLVIPGTYGDENGYLLEAARNHPAKLAVIGRISPGVPDFERRLEAWRAQPGMLGLRVVVRTETARARWEAGEFLPVFEGADRHAIPVCVNAPGQLEQLGRLAARYPNAPILIDHLGLPGPPTNPLGPETWRKLPALLDLARYPNVSVKATGVTLLTEESFPYPDLWDPLRRIIDAFGIERVMWGSDLTRLNHPYREAVGYFMQMPGLSDAERAMLYGANVRRILGWPRSTP